MSRNQSLRPSTTLSKAMLVSVLAVMLSLVSALTEEELIRNLKEFNDWAEQNKDSTRFQVKKFQQPVATIDSAEDQGGVEALAFLKMYRRHESGEIAEKIQLFRTFFEHYEEIDRGVFYRLCAVWLKREHFELVTGRKYIEQEHVVKGLQRQNARKFANKEIRGLPLNRLSEQLDELFEGQESFSLVDGAHWLVDGNLYARLGAPFMKEIFDQDLELTQRQTEIVEEDFPEQMEVVEDPVFTEVESVQEEVDKIDL